MKTNFRYLTGLVTLTLIVPAAADTLYSGLQNIPIPTDFGGVFLDVDGNTHSNSTFAGWDINPFFGGVDVANSSTFQPVRNGTGGLAPIWNFTQGATVGGSLPDGLGFATGAGGSQTHLGTGTGQFAADTPGYLGFKLGSNYGWMRVEFTANTSGAKILDWAYNTGGGPIDTGNVLQSAVVDSAQSVTLSSAENKSFTLGSQLTNTGGITNSVVKTGAGTTILTGANTYGGTTGVTEGKLLVNGSTTGSGTVGVASGATLGGTGGIAGAVTVNDGGFLAPGDAGVGKVSLTNNLTANQGSIFEWELAATPDDTTITDGVSNRGTSYDAVNVAGTLATTGTGAIFRVVLNGAQDFSETFWNTNRTWTDIFKSADAGTNVSFASIFSNSIQYYNSTTDLGTPTTQGYFTMDGSALNWTAVPEPTSALAGLLLGAGLLRRRRA